MKKRMLICGVSSLLAIVIALMVVGCGGGTANPTIKRTSEGSFFANVKNETAAVKACKNDQSGLGSQLKKLGASNVAVVVFEYTPKGLTETPGSVTGTNLAAGKTINMGPYSTICGVAVK